MTLKTRAYIASAMSGLVAIAGITGLAALASAAAPTLSATVQNSSNTVISTAPVGSAIHVSVVVASSTASTTPTGTVDFNLYSNQSCSGSPLAQTGVSLVNGQASSSNTTLGINGASFRVHYNGQGDFNTVGDSGCVSVSATQVAPSISLSLSNSNVQAGSYVYGIPNLVGETADASGTVQYRVYSNNTCSNLALNAGAKIVTNGATPNSDSWQFITPGTYYWQVAYTGDTNNVAATSSCTGAVLTVVATSTATTTPPTGGPSTISGNVFNDLNRNDVRDGSETGLSGWTIWLHKATDATSTPWWKKILKKHDGYNDPIVATATTDSNGNYSFGNLGAGQYFVEQSLMKGWKQETPDKKVTLTASSSSATVNFADFNKSATTTKPGKGLGDKNHEHEKDNDNDHGNKGDSHATTTSNNGWFQFSGNIPAIGDVFGWLHLGKK